MIDQIFIVLTGPLSIWLVNDERPHLRRWGAVVALLGQPPWFYAAWEAGQWGIFFVDFLFCYGWYKGYREHWTSWRECLKAVPVDCKLALTNLTDWMKKRIIDK